MHIVIDLQGAQSESRFRGIGRYSLSLAKAIARNRQRHTVSLVLNTAFPESVAAIRASFSDLIGPENIHVFHGLDHVNGRDTANGWRRLAAEAIREAFISSLRPDVVLISSLFEGFADDAVTSIPESAPYPTAAVLYDLIPLLNRENYLTNALTRDWYDHRISNLKRADALLAISESSAREAATHLGFSSERLTNISGAAGPEFTPGPVSEDTASRIRKAYRIKGKFVLYAPGGFDPRKNIPRLLRAWAAVPRSVRGERQLVIASRLPTGLESELSRTCRKEGLADNETVFTGYVPEDDLIDLYRLCELFVFPSLHEGFGLPALEAMSCGAPTIGSDRSSIPEVIGRADAMFDPTDPAAIAGCIKAVLSDQACRKDLAAYALERSDAFSWDTTAQAALKGLEALGKDAEGTKPNVSVQSRRLAIVVPTGRLAGGPAHRMRALIPELARTYSVDLFCLDGRAPEPPLPGIGLVLGANTARAQLPAYERVVHCLGDGGGAELSAALAKDVPGAIYLLDSTLSNRLEGAPPSSRSKLLYDTEGFLALASTGTHTGSAPLVWQDTLTRAVGVIAGSDLIRDRLQQTYGAPPGGGAWPVVPFIDIPSSDATGPTMARSEALATLGLGEGPVIAVAADPPTDTALLDQIDRSGGSDVQIVVLDSRTNADRERLATRIGRISSDIGNVVVVDPTHAPSLSAAVAAASTIAIAGERVAQGESGLARLLAEAGAGERIRIDGNEPVTPAATAPAAISEAARAFGAALEEIYDEAVGGLLQAERAIAHLSGSAGSQGTAPSNDTSVLDQEAAAIAIANTFPPRFALRQLLVDVSELTHRDARSGVQRVVRNIVLQWLRNPPKGWRVEPVYASARGYRYATRFTFDLLGQDSSGIVDQGVDTAPGDLLLMLDLQHHVASVNRPYFHWLRARGVGVYFVVYDLLPILIDGAFPKSMTKLHEDWLDVVRESDGAFCISRAVADELADWLAATDRLTDRPFNIGWFHLGADFTAAKSWTGLPANAQKLIETIKAKPTFLMVATVEPRKGHTQVLDAFDELWRAGVDVNLVIVGKEGWMVKPLVKRLAGHPERQKRLFWLEGISDEFLEQIYGASAGLLAASKGEGFGLPLIEAAQHKIPILARDIPVFREVAGEHAAYFSGETGAALAAAIRKWLDAYERGDHPRSDAMPYLSWKDAADAFGRKIVEGEFYRTASLTGEADQPPLGTAKARSGNRP
ncbi:glycosyltransferase family 4 protein [Amorphus orientalis]|uniref:Glycosyltransferase involved in cell wall biosynthesis n=1 Tax=Amorphus orientalis TaxID=649198 RepID=A0AAE4ASF5_9HYPH|nr:glycosyltransferase family 1 protein [Amorphus orientalis]MDQ0316211.1 glycosyltransferase involved in cell wall biosynthesis [Amorphus orientalis]